MSEVLVKEMKFKEGEGRFFVDKEKKLVRTIGIGILTANEMEEFCDLARNEMKKFNKGDVLYLHDGSNIDIKIYSNDQAKAAQKHIQFVCSYTKKSAVIYTSFMHQKSHQASAGMALPDNLKYFASTPEAMKWLLAD